MLSSESDVSSKRTMGSICILSMVIAILTVVFVGVEIKDNHVDLISMVFGGGIILLGVNAIESVFRKK